MDAKTEATRRNGPRSGQPDWPAIRHAREIGGKRWSQLERDFGLTRQRIQRRAVREGWRQPGEVVQKATEDFAARFVAREAEAVIEAFSEALDASRRILALATARIEAMEANPAAVDLGDLKNVAEIVRKAHSVEAAIGGLNGEDNWRPTHSDDDAMAKEHEDALRHALDSLSADER